MHNLVIDKKECIQFLMTFVYPTLVHRNPRWRMPLFSVGWFEKQKKNPNRKINIHECFECVCVECTHIYHVVIEK